MVITFLACCALSPEISQFRELPSINRLASLCPEIIILLLMSFTKPPRYKNRSSKNGVICDFERSNIWWCLSSLMITLSPKGTSSTNKLFFSNSSLLSSSILSSNKLSSDEASNWLSIAEFNFSPCPALGSTVPSGTCKTSLIPGLGESGGVIPDSKCLITEGDPPKSTGNGLF